MKVCISVGHSPDEQGAYNETFGITEFSYNTSLGKGVVEELEKLGHEVELVFRKSLAELPAQINRTKADVAVELHCNAFNKLVSGSETLHYPKSRKGIKLAQYVQDAVVETLDIRDRGIKESTRELILRKTAMPCIILEPGFIDNDVDMMIMIDKQQELAKAIAQGIHNYSLSR
ncbi:N-acetylmuramoyl-L-alanine amidase [Vibrio phage pVco-7]|uniref:N-acetylmuramoyl-L-alanine amidase n=1 Tax=Vibrio phage pVco-5 TaxID=1965485 RepID=A0A1W6JV24_9CAUD|nr:endolysin [Vibrio phage pVco-5]ARM71055.1 N-acetylmuramoyl-L-alanine amidase [Vibrio phage pVco-5]